MASRRLRTYIFIDASNIIYGTRDEGWKVDLVKLYSYLSKKFTTHHIHYFAGIEPANIKQKKLYQMLSKTGYKMFVKPVKTYSQNGHLIKKANCDVDLCFIAMRHVSKYDRAIFLTGDGDFEILLRYLVKIGKNVQVIASGRRTAREIKQLMAGAFTEINSLRDTLSFTPKK
jgi:uncharacterized LabA/DUF88 family protein